MGMGRWEWDGRNGTVGMGRWEWDGGKGTMETCMALGGGGVRGNVMAQ